MYAWLFPRASIDYLPTQRLGPQLQPRFASGDPPDLIGNSGAEMLPIASLVAEGQLADLRDLMTAPAFDTENAAFAETLIPNSQVNGDFDGAQLALHYVLTVYGVWHNQSWFDEQGYSYPETWEAMMALCAEIKEAGIAPWTYPGEHPKYIRLLMDQMVAKHGGIEAIKAVDNLAPGAWKQDAVRLSLEALRSLYDNGYFLEGSENLSHIEAQTEWLQGRAVFIPCGTWLPKEMRTVIPEGASIVIKPTPSLADDLLPLSAIGSWSSEAFHVSEQGANVQGGKEWLRLLFSKEGARYFSESTNSLTVVLGATDGIDLGATFASIQDAVSNAAENTISFRYPDWYPTLDTESSDQLRALLTGRISVEDYVNVLQLVADTIAADDSIQKYTRE
jgi:N-acetylglucosamine transport system substrate-binding protein